jgi:hypothetical protein
VAFEIPDPDTFAGSRDEEVRVDGQRLDAAGVSINFPNTLPSVGGLTITAGMFSDLLKCWEALDLLESIDVVEHPIEFID